MGRLDTTSKQFDRVCSLVVLGSGGKALDLSQFRIKFAVKRSDSRVPNTADILIYNMDPQDALRVKKEFTKVSLLAGYPGNSGVIFEGNIAQTIIGRESATDTFVNILSGDGDRAYTFAVVNKSIQKGSRPIDQINAATDVMTPLGVVAGNIGDFPIVELPRGKVMFGPARNYLSGMAQTYLRSWSIQNGKIEFVARKAYLAGSEVTINETNGMIGTPQQTNEGVNVKCLLNPLLQVNGRIHLNNDTILRQKLNLVQIAEAGKDTKKVNELTPRGLNADGTYRVYVLEHTGDTRGIEWYSSVVSLNIDVSANPVDSVTGGIGG